MTTASPMPPLESVTQESPRVRAAMKVLGIMSKDLEPKSREIFEKGFSKETAEARYETFERKRRFLLKQILDLSNNTKPSGETSLNVANNNASFLEEVMAKEAANLDKLRERAKHDVKKICVGELAIKNLAAETLKKQEDQQKKFRENQKVIQDKLKAQKAELDKKKEKSQINRERADANREEGANKLTEELKAANLKKEGVILKKMENHQEHVAEKSETWRKITARQDIRVAEEMRGQEKMYADYLGKHEKHADRLDGIIEEKRNSFQSLQEKLDSAVQVAREKKEKQEQDRLAKHSVFVVHESKVRVQAVTDHNAKWQEIIVGRRKVDQIYKQRYETVLKEKAKRWDGNDRLTRSFSDMSDLKSSRHLEMSSRIKDTHAVMDDLVASNRARNARAHQHHQEQALHKVENVRKRVTDLHLGKFNAQQRRYDAIKNCAIEKMKLEDEVARIRDAPADRMNKLFDELGLNVEPEKEGKKDEKEDAEAAKAD